MAICALVDAQGFIHLDTAPPADQTQCNLVLMSGTEAAGFTNLFSIPAASDLQVVWMTGFSTPLILYLAAHLVGKVARFWDSHPG